MSLISISLCLSDLKEKCPEKIKQAGNGKKYINLCLAGRKEAGKYGETHTLFVSQTKEERQAGTPIIYVGSGTEYTSGPVTQQDINDAAPAEENGDLPF